jgi:NADH:ubiquinone oxidoreductase subunit 5 (subunit L)/multisubunit Na+/H+ antiporter MnhA subunit
MPVTWITFFIGAAAIIGLPPLNGFVSEWLVYQGLWTAGEAPGVLRLAVLGIPSLALIGALALACFAKVAGVVFLGTPRSAHLAVREREIGMLAPMLGLAGLCVLLGIAPAVGITVTRSAAQQLANDAGAALPTGVLRAAGAITLVGLVTLALMALLWGIRSVLLRGYPTRGEVTWSCGYADLNPRMQYTGSSFASPLLSMFGRMSGVRTAQSTAALETHPFDWILDRLALPLWNGVRRAAFHLRPIQQGQLYLYLLYVMLALLALLGYLWMGFRS